MARRSNPPFVNGVPELLILQLLSQRPMYGYEMVQAIRAATGERLEFGEGCIYPILHRLESEGMLAANQDVVSGRTRYVYRATGKGKKQLVASVSAWQQVVDSVNCALQGGKRGQAALA